MNLDVTKNPSIEDEVENNEIREESASDSCRLKTRRSIPEIAWSFVCFALMLVTLCSGFNFLPLICAAFAAATAVFLFAQAVRKKPLSTLLWFTYLVIIVGLFAFFLIWGADSFEYRLWWNLILIVGPVILAVCVRLLNKLNDEKRRRIIASLVTFLMILTSLVYLLFMNLRVRPIVQSLQEGHDDYLSSISSSSISSNAPNVIVILMDDMGYADLSLYSYLDGTAATINTPNIDSIADGGIIMDNFYAASPVCSPSRFSLLTGRYSSRGYLDNVVFPTVTQSTSTTPWSPTHFVNPYQFLNNVDGILGDEITFTEVLQAAGYTTGLIGKWNLGDYGEYLPTNQGFDYFYGSYYVNDMTPYDWVFETGDGWYDGALSESARSHAENLDQSESSRLLTENLLEFIDTSVQNGDRFLAYYATPWPHYPIYSDNNSNGKGDTTDDSYIDCLYRRI